ncbi:MAG: hypothetical protein GXO76_05590 [Calditrichaeota bacterium]|nr:hypothetical protein [Calditrichota bacterium]
MNRTYGRAAIFIIAALFVTLGILSCNLNHGLHPVPITGIGGTITFQGQWPENTEFVRIVVYRDYPPPSLMAITSFSDPIPFGSRTYAYELQLPPGTYHWILVAWKPKNAPFTDIRTIGQYYAEGDSSKPGHVIVRQDQLTPHVDIVADFGVLKTP